MTDLCRVFYLLDHCNDILPKYDPKEDRYQTKDITGKYIE